jgi:pSer/pThr/pTyr-binding forkhead associated (FHA) protein
MQSLSLGPAMAVRLEVHTQGTRNGACEPLLYEFDQARVSIGRGSSSDVQLPHPTVSATHASVRVHNTGYAAFDEGSTNGTFVNGVRIPPGRAKPLRSGDVLHVGEYALSIELAVAIPAGTSVERTAAMARRLAREIFEGRGAPPSAPTLTVLNGPSEGRVLPVPEPPGTVRIGRGETCDLALSDADLSREHAVIRRIDDGVWIEDLASKNGVKVNGRSADRRRLRDRDEVELGKTVLSFDDPEAAALRALEKESDAERAGPLLDPKPTPANAGEETEGHSTEPTDGDAPEADRWAFAVPAENAEASEATPPKPAPPRRSLAPGEGRLADMMIYMLAGAVLALSAVGLYLLLRASG